MSILDYFKEVNAQKQINKLAKKYKNKKVVIYGAGEYFNLLNKNYDISKLNIVAICDKKFETSKELNKTKYNPIAPQELKEYDYDLIMVALYDDASLMDYLEYDLLINTKNENKKVISLIKPTFLCILRLILFGWIETKK